MKLFNFLSASRPPLVEQSLADLATMIERAERMFGAATSYLLDNEPLPFDLSEADNEINDLEQKIRRAVLEHMAVAPQDETSLTLLILSIVQDAERCGDLAKSIGKAAALADGPRMGPHVDALRPLRDRVLAAFAKARAGFESASADDARAVMEAHDTIKADGAAYLQALSTADDLTTNRAVVLAIASRMILRTSSHLSNIISTVALPFDQIRRSPTWGDDE